MRLRVNSEPQNGDMVVDVQSIFDLKQSYKGTPERVHLRIIGDSSNTSLQRCVFLYTINNPDVNGAYIADANLFQAAWETTGRVLDPRK